MDDITVILIGLVIIGTGLYINHLHNRLAEADAVIESLVMRVFGDQIRAAMEQEDTDDER